MCTRLFSRVYCGPPLDKQKKKEKKVKAYYDLFLLFRITKKCNGVNKNYFLHVLPFENVKD